MRSLALLLAPLTWAQVPDYSAASLVNAASNEAGRLAPNTIATLYGANLAFATRALSAEDVRGGGLPTVLPGTGVRVTIGNVFANILYVSPTQVNLLVPSLLTPGQLELQLVRDGRAGPRIALLLAAAAPELFATPQGFAIATHVDGSLASPEAPTAPGEIVVLYATGLGRTDPDSVYGEIPRRAAPLARAAEVRILLDGAVLPAAAIAYAGVTPGFAGLYQVNLRLPETIGPDPELQVRIGEASSRAGLRLAVRRPGVGYN